MQVLQYPVRIVVSAVSLLKLQNQGEHNSVPLLSSSTRSILEPKLQIFLDNLDKDKGKGKMHEESLQHHPSQPRESHLKINSIRIQTHRQANSQKSYKNNNQNQRRRPRYINQSTHQRHHNSTNQCISLCPNIN